MRKPRRPRHQPSTIDRLDPEVRDLIHELRIDKGWHIDEIRDQLIKLGQGHVSRSALGRHFRSIDDVASETQEATIYAQALATETATADAGKLLDMNAQLLSTNMFKLMIAAKDGEGIQLGTKETKEFSEALRNIAGMRRTQLDTLEKAEKRGEERERKKAAENATKVARAKGLSKETVDAIRFAVLGSDA